MRQWRLLVTLAGLAGAISCARREDLRLAANNGPKEAGDVSAMIASLRDYAEVYPTWKPARGDEGSASDFLHLFFGNAYDGRLVDLLFFVDVDQEDGKVWKPTIYSAMTRGEERPRILAEEQQAWVLLVVAAPAKDCFTSSVNFASIAPVESPSEIGVVAAIAAVAKLVPSSTPPKSQSKSVKLFVPNTQCQESAGSTSKSDAKSGGAAGSDGSGSASPPSADTAFRWIGEGSDGRSLYAGLVGLELAAGTTNRVVVSTQQLDERPDPKDKKATEAAKYRIEPQTSAVTTFRNASRPYIGGTLGLGARFELSGVRTTSGSTERGNFYNPDLYVMVHLFPPLRWLSSSLDAFQLDQEWYPSVFLATNLITQSPLTDIVAGVRMPIFVKRAGIDLGLDWSNYSFDVVTGCTSNCIVNSQRHLGLFLGFDYQL